MSVSWSRVLIIGMIIGMPLLIFWEFSQINYVNISWITTDPALQNLILLWIAPAIYATGWIFMLVVFATRSSDTAEAVAASSKIIPMRMRLFYTVNALFLTIIFVFPVVTPFVAIIAFASFGWRLTTFRVEWDSGKKVGAGTYIVMILFVIPPALLSIIYIPNTIDLAIHFWNDYWLKPITFDYAELAVVDILYKFSMCLATALTFGSLIYFIQTGASEYDQARLVSGKDKSFGGVKFLQVALFFFFLYLEYALVPIRSLFYWAGLIIVIFISIVGLVRKGGAGGVIQLDKTYFLGYLLTAVFFVGELWHYDVSPLGITISTTIKSALLIITAIVYIVIFAYKFLTYEEEEAF